MDNLCEVDFTELVLYENQCIFLNGQLWLAGEHLVEVWLVVLLV